MKYLNEENYLKTNRKIKIIGVVIMTLGLILIGVGVYFLIKSKNIVEPNMMDPNWFSVSSNKMHTESSGMFMIIPGIFLTIVGVMVRFVMANTRGILAYKMTEMMPIAEEGLTKMAPTVTKVAKEAGEELAPMYGKVAKEIAKGIKEGMEDK